MKKQEKADAINKWFYFSMNYPDRFIDKCWIDNPGLAAHLTGKFKLYYDDYGPYGVINAFYAALDEGNRKKLLMWVLNNYYDEITLVW